MNYLMSLNQVRAFIWLAKKLELKHSTEIGRRPERIKQKVQNTKMQFAIGKPQRCINLWSKNAALALYQAIKKRYDIFRTSHRMFNTLSPLKMS